MAKIESWFTSFMLGAVCGFFPTSLLLLITSNMLDKRVLHDLRFEQANSDPHKEQRQYSPLHQYNQKGEEVAFEMAKKVRILCWVATVPENHKTKAVHIRDTWGKRCNILLFMSSKNDSSLPSIAITTKEGREYLFDKTKAAMEYVYKFYMESIDWVLKADDDTFVVVENLRYILAKHDPSKALYLGCRFKPFATQGFMSGGAGYVISRAALRKFVQEAIPNKDKCLQSGSGAGEDVQMGICLMNVNVAIVDSRDDKGRGRFFPYSPEFHLFPVHSQPYEWYWEYQYYPDHEGLDCCSSTAVSFHYISPHQLRVLDYLVYTLRPHGTSLYYRNSSIVIHI
ncbi:glycoprotein-N-acetylgalactosamine 3-beta-galactosyltransferase 1-like [Homalodisca vitripennis]|uniref:glycoprotein-N-acetylgalactosamine 3-beta-galactosyltransferase 1-like n=1 Tax=Homalodisca vitripennis TaxID=197043 RepID=UPI001EEB074C|nr:glycoprotein-N-acetylgalactosamine 3-beta-galactosyltransferase 1-like [Homalodisca vitripennis]